MKKEVHSNLKAHLIRGALYLMLLLAICISGTLLAFFRPQARSDASQRTLTFAERVAYQRSIEEVYWRHRIWPKENSKPKPSLDELMSQAQLEKKVTDYLRKSQGLDGHWQRPITVEQLQAEMDRMAQHTKRPDVLRELFEAMGNDPFVIAECLARPALSDRLLTDLAAHEKELLTSWRSVGDKDMPRLIAAASTAYSLPKISDGIDCTDDTWSPTTLTNAPEARDDHTAVWTGSEMIVWGGEGSGGIFLNTGGRYDPSTDSWTATSLTNAPASRYGHTAVWTGSEMIVWGGLGSSGFVNTGSRYNPSTDSWIATTNANAPAVRWRHTAVWTGSEMIVWGGESSGGIFFLNTGGRYDPGTDSWMATSTTSAPEGRSNHTAVWTGSEMIVWGGYKGSSTGINTGGRYDPTTDNWTATSLTNAPDPRFDHTAVWSGSEMIAWGGYAGCCGFVNTGGRYSAGTDSWTATTTTSAPTGRYQHTAVWTGSEMIIWGGFGQVFSNVGGRYDPDTDSWTATSNTNAPTARLTHTAVWTGSKMILWGGQVAQGVHQPSRSPLVATTPPIVTNTGGRYCAQSATPSPAPSATPSPTPTPTPMTRPTPVSRPRPTRPPRP
jgi:N-acetylneuraminic acid mutarotase